MKDRDSDRLYVELRNDRNAGGKALYGRLLKAQTILMDKGWVEDPAKGGGDEGTALDRLEEDCFGDVGMSLPQLLEILRHVPQEETWKAHKYNIRRMHAEMVERKQLGKQPARREPVAEMDAKDRRIAKLQNDLHELKEKFDLLRMRAKDLEAENKQLRRTLEQIGRALPGGLGVAG